MVNSRNNRNSEISNSRGRPRKDVRFPTAPIKATLPQDYTDTLGAIKRRIQETRLRVVLSGNSEMVMLYWDVGRIIIDRQEQSGWGARVIDRLSADLRDAFPDTKGFSPRNLKYMRTFSSAWPKRKFVQEALAQIPWYHLHHFKKAISDTIEALQTGVHRLRDGTIFKRFPIISEISDAQMKQSLKERII
ncbi:MAG: DUF1016 family protein [Desulfobacteraceae bacterium]|nr:MAG: DUF1016 family protein [Desulfobacteraceae bacterium]